MSGAVVGSRILRLFVLLLLVGRWAPVAVTALAEQDVTSPPLRRQTRSGSEDRNGARSADHRSHRHDVHGQVVSGTPVRQGDVPFLAFIELPFPAGVIGNGGGTPIFRRFVLTTDHYTPDSRNPNKSVRPSGAIWIGIGQVDESKLAADNAFSLVAVTQDPGSDPEPDAGGNIADFRHDDAFLELDQPVSPNVGNSVSFVGAGDPKFAQAALSVVGWWPTATSRPPSPHPLAAVLDVMSDPKCDAADGSGIDPASTMCASAPGRAICSRDRGSLLFAQKLIGCHKQKNGKIKRIPMCQQTEVGVAGFGGERCEVEFGVFVRLGDPAINRFTASVVANPQSARATRPASRPRHPHVPAQAASFLPRASVVTRARESRRRHSGIAGRIARR